jgi:hypothetical protein
MYIYLKNNNIQIENHSNEIIKDFRQSNQGVDYITHSSVPSCKHGYMGFLLTQLCAVGGNVRNSAQPVVMSATLRSRW